MFQLEKTSVRGMIFFPAESVGDLTVAHRLTPGAGKMIETDAFGVRFSVIMEVPVTVLSSGM